MGGCARWRGSIECAHEYSLHFCSSRCGTCPKNCLVCSIRFPHQAPQPIAEQGTSNSPANSESNPNTSLVLIAEEKETAKNSRLKRFASRENGGEGLVTPEDLVLAQC
jgi:hypothetical protein